MTTTFYVIRNKESGRLLGGPKGTSQAPHLYDTEGKARGQHGYGIRRGTCEVVPVELVIPGATFVERLQQEYDQLIGRAEKLRAFVTRDDWMQIVSSPDERDRQLKQLSVMEMYAIVLFDRLAAATNKPLATA